MLFKLKDLKNFLLSLQKQKVEIVNIQSSHLNLIINTSRKKNWNTRSQKDKIRTFNKDHAKIKSIEIHASSKTNDTSTEQGLYFTIVSPMIGTFYRSPAPNETPFININDSVKAKQTVCIIEAMKLMNEIESEVNGYIAEILVEDGDIVDCGQALMRVKEK